MAASDRRPSRDHHCDALARPGTAADVARTVPGRVARHGAVDSFLERLRVLHRKLRQLQQDLGISLGSDRHLGLAVADLTRSPARSRTERRGRAESQSQCCARGLTESGLAVSLSHLALVHCSLLASRAGVVSAAQAFQPGRRSIEAGPSTTEVLNVTYFNEVQRG